MTVSNNTTRQIFTCNGVTTARTANFRVIDESQLRVVLYTIATGATVDLTGSGTDYTVTSAGGATTDFTTTVAYSSAYKIIALLDMPLSQETDYVANDSFPAESHEAALDKLTLIAQQQADILSRCATLPEFAATNLTVVLPTPTDGYALVWDGVTGTIRNSTVSIATLETEAAALYAIAADISTVAAIDSEVVAVAGNAANINTVAGISAAVSTVAGISGAVSAVSSNSTNINTVAGISANVTTVAGVSANVTTVAGIQASVTTVAGLSTQVTGVYNIRTDVTTVAGISGNVTTVAGISANVTTVAGISANVTTVAGSSTNINTVAGISANVTTVAGVSTAVSTVATNIADVSTCATNIAAILAAPGYATAAAASAASAAASASGISMRGSCRVCATGALTANYLNGVLGVGATLTNSGVQAAFAQDGVTVAVGERVLVPSQASALQNGMYTLTVAGDASTNWVLTRATDYDEASEIVEGTATIIEEGTVSASHIYVMTHHGAITVGTTAIDYTALTANATSANTLTTPRGIYGNNFDGSAALTQVIASTYGGTGNGFAKFSGPASTEKTFTLPNASATILTDNALVTAAQGGTGNGFTKFSGPTTSERTKTLRDASDTILELGGSYTPTGTFTNMILATPNLGTPSAGTLTNCTGLPIAGGGTGLATMTTAYAVLCAGTTATGALQPLSALGASGTLLTSNGAGALPSFQSAPISNMVLNTGTASITIDGTDKGKVVELTGSTARTFSITAAATLGSGWWCITKNSSTAELTLDGNGSELDSLANYISYPGEVRLLQCTGSVINSTVLHPFDTGTRTATFTFTLPPGYSFIEGFVWGSGASGGKGATNGGGGGGGGACVPFNIRSATIGAAGTTVTCTVGAGGAAQASANTAGNAGNSSTFGTLVTAYGGGRGGGSSAGAGGGGGGAGSQGIIPALAGAAVSGVGGNATTTTAGTGGKSWEQQTAAAANIAGSVYSGAGGDASTGVGVGAYYGGGGGAAGFAGSNTSSGGYSIYGAGAGGGGGSTGAAAGGLSQFGGNGGAGATGANTATSGTAPGGGGGGSVTGTSGAGGDGGFRIVGVS